MAATTERVGYIQRVFFDDTQGEVVILGGAGFATREEDEAAWADIPAFSGETSFMADHLNAQRGIVEDKLVSADTCERLMGKPIAQLIAHARANLAAEITALRGHVGASDSRAQTRREDQ